MSTHSICFYGEIWKIILFVCVEVFTALSIAKVMLSQSVTH